MTDMTLDMKDLRRVAGHLVDIEEGSYAKRLDKALRAWTNDRKRIEEARWLIEFAPHCYGSMTREWETRRQQWLDAFTTKEKLCPR